MFGFRFPGAEGQTGLAVDHGRLARIGGIEELHQALIMLLSTRPGERALTPDFGCPLHQLTFEPNDATTAGLAMRLVADAITRHERRAVIEALDAYPDPQSPECLVIELAFRDIRDGQQGHLVHRADLGGGG